MDAKKIRRVVTYKRTSSEDQRQRKTIETQTDELDRRLKAEEGIRFIRSYDDDGVSGTIPMAKRPAGKQLLEDAARGLFDEVWVYKIDRLGRDEIDPLVIWRQLEALGIRVHSVTEGISDSFVYSIHVAMAAKERRTFLERSAAGMERAVKQGRFPGGICPLGYIVEGEKQHAKLAVSERIIWADWTASELVRKVFFWVGVEGWSCRRVADYLNSMGVPTSYQHIAPKQARAERKTGLQSKWRAGRIRNMLMMTVYKGVYEYGKRTKKKDRETWKVEAPRLISDELWQAAQETLNRNRLMPNGQPQNYLLTGLMKCGHCGKTYCAAHGRDEILWWRCNGRMTHRYDKETRCKAKGIKGTLIEKILWDDVERWLRDPGDLLDELQAEKDLGQAAALIEAERITLGAQLVTLDKERKGYLRQNAQGVLNDKEMAEFLSEIDTKRAAIDARLRDLEPQTREQPVKIPADLLEQIRAKLDSGLTHKDRREIVRLLVRRVVVTTEVDAGNPRGKVKVEVEYRFPGAVSSSRGRGSSRPPA